MDDQDKTPMAEPLDPKNLNLWCKPCDTYLVAGRFPMDVKAFSKATKAARCPTCGQGKGNLFMVARRQMKDEPVQPDAKNPQMPENNR